jgi:thymidylate synthase
MAKIDKKYHKLLRMILKKGTKYEDPNRKGVNRIQIPSYTFKHDFKDGFPAITTKKLYWKGVVGELIWFLRGDTSIKYLVSNNINIWNKDAFNFYKKKFPNSKLTLSEFIYKNKEGSRRDNLGRVYGAQWRNWIDIGWDDSIIGLDQISNLINGLKENPMGTRHIVTAWNPAEINDMALPPCHWSFEILVEPISTKKRNNNYTKDFKYIGSVPTSVLDANNEPKYQFTLKWHQRSVDTFLGLPFNIASYALLAQIIGSLTNMIPKGIIGDLSNVHIYEPHLDAVKEQLSRDVDKYNSPKLIQFFEPNTKDDITEVYLDLLQIQQFELEGYESYSRISAEMLAYNK